jgi:hypothetical protein
MILEPRNRLIHRAGKRGFFQVQLTFATRSGWASRQAR